jgi:hypothetical protein
MDGSNGVFAVLSPDRHAKMMLMSQLRAAIKASFDASGVEIPSTV